MKYFILILFFFGVFTSQAQTKAVTESGDTILVYDNGTWKNIQKFQNPTEIESTVKVSVVADEFTGDKLKTSDVWLVFGENEPTRNTISGYAFQKSSIPVFYLRYSGDLGCMSQLRSTMMVKLTNGEVIEFTQITDTECGDAETVGFIPATKEQIESGDYEVFVLENIEQLKSYDWETIRISGTEYYSDLKPKVNKKIPNPEQFFRQHIIALESN
ncbi:hypothetical protein AAGF08_08805 [Algoriphagus sp. SE2]|uniref:hypothetical protein n=1 Tax=Algoriphagus sp. SE2 TaxID=3141536 RepID=UPI0031CCEFF6